MVLTFKSQELLGDLTPTFYFLFHFAGIKRRNAQVTVTQHTNFGSFKISTTLENDHFSKVYLN